MRGRRSLGAGTSVLGERLQRPYRSRVSQLSGSLVERAQVVRSLTIVDLIGQQPPGWFCTAIASHAGLEELIAKVLPDNIPMLTTKVDFPSAPNARPKWCTYLFGCADHRSEMSGVMPGWGLFCVRRTATAPPSSVMKARRFRSSAAALNVLGRDLNCRPHHHDSFAATLANVVLS